MKKIITVIFFLYILITMVSASEEMLFHELESFTSQGHVEVKTHYPNWYKGVPSAGKMMRFYRGSAEKEIMIQKAGLYDVFIRVLKRKNYTFQFSISDGKNFIFTEQNPSVTEETSSFVWYKLTTELLPGKVQLKIRNDSDLMIEIDCIVLVQSSRKYTPNVSDFFAPLYVQVKSESDKPFFLQMFGRLPRAPWSVGYHNISKNGIFHGITAGTNSEADMLRKNESSPWVNIAPLLGELGENLLIFSAMTNFKDLHKEADFTIYFSSTKSMDGLIGQLKRSGVGCGLRCKLNISEKRVVSAKEESRADLKRAENLGPMPGRVPQKFPIGTGISISPCIDEIEIVKNELETLRLLGINMLRCDISFLKSGLFKQYGFNHIFAAHTISYLAKNQGCLSTFRIDYEKELERLAGVLKENAADDKVVYYGLWDEPSYPLEHVLNCPECKNAFPKFLKEKNVALENPILTDDKNNAENYYWTVRYRNYILTEFFKKASTVMHKTIPNLPTGVNIANAVFKNMMNDGCDWFEMDRSGAVFYHWSEDWLNQQTSFQLCGYLIDLMRSSTAGKIPLGIYNVLSRTPWEIEAKAFSELGHGVNALQFFNYGPHYAANSDFNSQRSEIYAPIKSVAYTIGAVDDEIIQAPPMLGDVALLYSTVSDIWNMQEDNLRGCERSLLYLLLRHAGLRSDILYEGDLALNLSKYRVLFIVASHLETKSLQIILDWVKNGGSLYLLPGSLMFDQYNQPLDFDFPRGRMTVQPKGDYHVRRLDKSPWISSVVYNGEEIPVIYVKQELYGKNVLFKNKDGTPAVIREDYGKGNITAFGFFPGHAYVAGGKHEGIAAGTRKYFSCFSYKAAPRKMLRRLFGKSVVPYVETDNYLVEANILDHETKILLVTANWFGKKQQVTFTVNGVFGTIISVKRGSDLKVFEEDSKTKITLEIEVGDIIIMEKKK